MLSNIIYVFLGLKHISRSNNIICVNLLNERMFPFKIFINSTIFLSYSKIYSNYGNTYNP